MKTKTLAIIVKAVLTPLNVPICLPIASSPIILMAILSCNGKNKCIPNELINKKSSITLNSGVHNPKMVIPIALKIWAIMAKRISPKNPNTETSTIQRTPGNSLGNSISPLSSAPMP